MLAGENELNLDWFSPPPSIEERGVRLHYERYVGEWGRVSGYCGAVAGDAALIDTTNEAVLAYGKQFLPR